MNDKNNAGIHCSFWVISVVALLWSLMGEVMTMIHTLALTGSTDLSFFKIFMMMAMPLVVAAFLIGYSKLAESKGWVGWRPGEP